MTDDLRWVALALALGEKRVVFRNLIAEFADVDAILGASTQELLRVRGITRELAAAIRKSPDSPEFAKERETIERLSLNIMTLKSEDYPENLRHIPDPPALLYVRGELEARDSFAIAIVGTRTCTHYGKQTAENLGMELASMGLTIVSGLARGIDSHAHRGALMGKGRTIAVLGTGLDNIYPAEHSSLADEIAKSGAVVSEFPCGIAPAPRNFPIRNRVISGLALGTVVVEAPPQSGALITARLALDQGREVFAVPGNITAQTSRGPNQLIRQGAKSVLSATDIIEEIAPEIKGMMREETIKQAAEAKL
ncbi:MAG: DNA-processing protein DprA, partial [Candidatus Coatesbacteria bacterium]|nr:DNA-processing protein DprA [Candidatus Coatesbacteria bacterium]